MNIKLASDFYIAVLYRFAIGEIILSYLNHQISLEADFIVKAVLAVYGSLSRPLEQLQVYFRCTTIIISAILIIHQPATTG